MATKLVKRGGTYSVRYVVPKRMRPVVGYEQKWRTTGTGDKREAERRARRILTQLEDHVEAEYLLKAGSVSNTKASINYVFEQVRKIMEAPINVGLSADSLAKLEADGKLPYSTAPGDGGEQDDVRRALVQQVIEEHLAARGLPLDAGSHAFESDHLRLLKRASKLSSLGDSEKSLDDAIEQYLNTRTGKVVKSTLKRIQGVLEDFNQWAGHPPVSEVSRKLAGRYVADVIAPRDAAYKTKSWHVSALRRAWKYFVSRDWTADDRNPWEGHLENYRESSRGDASKETKRRPYLPEELQKLRTELGADDPLYQSAVLCLHTGARVEEIAGMKVGDVNLPERFMAVPVGKNRNSMRQLAVHKAIVPILEALTEGRSADEYLFSTLSGGGYDGKLSKSLTNRGWRFKVTHFDNDPRLVFFHSLRNTFVTELEKARVDPLLIQRLTGHTPQEITFSVYSAGPLLGAMREAVDSIDFGF